MIITDAQLCVFKPHADTVFIYVVPLLAGAVAVILLADLCLCLYCIKKCQQRKLLNNYDPSRLFTTTESIDADNTLDQASLLESSFESDESTTHAESAIGKKSKSHRERSGHKAGARHKTSISSKGSVTSVSHDVSQDVSRETNIISHETSVSHDASRDVSHETSIISYETGINHDGTSISHEISVSHEGSTIRGGTGSNSSREGNPKIALKLNELDLEEEEAPEINVLEPTLVDEDVADDAGGPGHHVAIDPMSWDDDDDEDDSNFLSPFY